MQEEFFLKKGFLFTTHLLTINYYLTITIAKIRSREYRFTHMNCSLLDIPFLSEALSGERIWVIINPKRCGLFGQLRRRGGSKSARWEIAVSGCFNVHPSSTNSTSYESRHLQLKFETSVRSLKLIVWPQDVSEVNEVKMKKIWGENPKITNFWLTET